MRDIISQFVDAVANVSGLSIQLHLTDEKVRLARYVYAGHQVYFGISHKRSNLERLEFERGYLRQQFFEVLCRPQLGELLAQVPPLKLKTLKVGSLVGD